MIIDPSRATVELDSITCSHCNGVKFLAPAHLGFEGSAPGDTSDRRPTIDEIAKKCLGCLKWICKRCTRDQEVNGAGCVTYERRLDEMERAFQRNRSREVLVAAVTGG